MIGIKRGAQHVMKAAAYIGHGIKENTELAEHEAGVDNVKKGASSVFNKMRNVITVFHNRLFPGSIIFIHELDFKRF
jgi:hypothetical protein